jgi:hypothetical protein
LLSQILKAASPRRALLDALLGIACLPHPALILLPSST